jgi:DNA-binding NtrC family response regulator
VTSAPNAATNTNRDNNNNRKPPARILAVDDDPDTVRVLALSLLHHGFLVDAFTNAKDALQEIKSNPERYSLVLSDSHMPELSGVQLAKKVKEINQNVKVLLLSGSEIINNAASDAVAPAAAATPDIDGFVQKPIASKKLTDKILSLIGETRDRIYFKD